MNLELKIEYVPITSLVKSNRPTRRRSAKATAKLAGIIAKFGFINPVITDDEGRVLAGHGRIEAAKSLGMTNVPTVALSHMTDADKRAYALAENRLAEDAKWDREALADEFKVLVDLGFDLALTGFEQAEIDVAFEVVDLASPQSKADKRDDIPAVAPRAISRQGDVWQCGRHRVGCGDARDVTIYAKLMAGDVADMVFTDPPYNIAIDGNVGGRGSVKHREFTMASGEMSRVQFTEFLTTSLGAMAAACRNGAIAFVCMDWRHSLELQTAGETVFSELKNVCVWNKSNAGMGTFYRSKHEFIFVFKIGDGEHINNFGLGETGRPRTNVWDYPGISSFGKDRDTELALHPTVKPTALVAEAIKDCSKRGGIILDAFGGSGTTMIAAESCGRSARLIEYDPLYCDVIVRRFEAHTGQQAILADGWNTSFQQVAQTRSAEAAE